MNDQDILSQINDVDLSKVETSFPILATGIVSVTIGKCEFVTEDSKKKPGEKNTYLHVDYSLAQPWKTVGIDGAPSKPVNPGDRGSGMTERIYVGKFTDKNGEEKWYGLDRIAKLREAVYGKASEGTKFIPPEMIGQPVLLNLKFNPAPVNKDTKEVYGPRTEIAGYVRKGKS